jgi:hypothetical protein
MANAVSTLEAPPVAPATRARPVVQLPRLGDPRLSVAAVVVSVQVLGQVSLGFDLSIAQILVALLTAGLIEGILTYRSGRVIAWPASALLTGNGIALILRVPGTVHGDWWSMRGWYVFAATAAVGVLSKYVIRWGDRPWFNPSNLALVLTFLILGAQQADPQDLWWGPWSVGLALTYAVVVVGGLVITRRLGLLAVSATFWVTFAALMAVLAASGHAMTARWNLGPVEGVEYWRTLALSPEILIFVFFMITDPRTAARGRAARVLYGAAVAATCALFVSFQSTEYATKVALLTGLVVVCGFRPLLERWAPAGDGDRGWRTWIGAHRSRPGVLGLSGVIVVAAVLAGSAVAVTPAAPAPAAPAGASRPDIRPGRDQRPTVEVGAAAAGVGNALDRATAQRIATDVVEDVLVADRAVATGDDAMAATVAAGAWLRELRALPRTPVPDRTVQRATVDVTRDGRDFQARPTLTVTLQGTRDGSPWTATYQVVDVPGGAMVMRATT